MPVSIADPRRVKREYGVLCQRHFPQQTLPTPFGATYCVLAPSEATDPHQHHEGETFYVARGRGEMVIEGEAPTVIGPGDVVYIRAHARHVLTNLSSEDELAFYSVWWDDQTAASANLPERSLVIAAPPTPNGDLHLGHLSGPYVAADMYARYLRLRNVAAVYACGSDDNQSYTAVKGRALGISPADVTERVATANEATLAAMGVKIDYYLRPTRSPAYVAYVQAFFERLVEAGQLELRRAPSLCCVPCGLYLYEAHVSGGCPHCGEPTMGNGCEACYRPNDCIDLQDPRCVKCGAAATREERERYYFPLEAHRAVLETFLAETSLSPHLRALADELLAGPLPAVGISHVADWGIPVPGRPGQVIYEWFEMAAGFLYQAGQLGGATHFWQEPGAEIVQFFGFDNAFFFLAFLPLVLRAYDPAIRLPRALVANEFYQLEGSKFSTSRRHAIWGDEALAHVPADVLRFYLAYDRPEGEQTSFSLAGLAGKIQDELVTGWDGWLADLDRRAGGIVPLAGKLDAGQQAFHERLCGYARELAACYDAADFSPRRAVRALARLVADARDFGRVQAYTRSGTAVALELAAARQLALLASPLMPDFAARLLAALGEAGEPRWDATATLLPAGRPLGNLQVGGFTAALAGVRALAEARRT